MLARVIAIGLLIVVAAVVYLPHREQAAILANVGTCVDASSAPSEAIEACGVLLSEPEHDDAIRSRFHYYQALGHFELEQYDLALVGFEDALALTPRDIRVWRWKSHVLQHMERFDEALQAADSALTIDPSDQYSLKKRGGLLQDLGRLDEAEAYYTQLALDDPEAAWVPYRLGAMLHQQKRYARAASAYGSAVKLDPEDIRIRRSFIETCMQARADCPPLFPEARSERPTLSCADARRLAIETMSDQNKSAGHPESGRSDADLLIAPETAWVAASAGYLIAAMAFQAEPTREVAEGVILYDRLLTCSDDSYRESPLFDVGDAHAEMQRLFGPEVRENLLDLAHATLD